MIILVFAIFMTTLMFLILGTLYGEDHVDCKLIEFEIVSACKKGKSVDFVLNNNADKSFNFKLNDIKNSNYIMLSTDSGKKISANLLDETTITILPYFVLGPNEYECKGKIQKINSEVLITC